MKIFLLILSGVASSLVAFAGGVLTTIIFLTAEPQPDRSLNVDASGLWTTVPARVNADASGITRVPARAAQPADANDTSVAASGSGGRSGKPDDALDAIQTGAVSAGADEPPAAAVGPKFNSAHRAWCAKRFRSYRLADNSYRPYGGGRRPCISPYFDDTAIPVGLASNADAQADEPATLHPSTADFTPGDEEPNGYPTFEHVRSCFSRYRSYRPEDNTYQPYSGGPRRQCK